MPTLWQIDCLRARIVSLRRDIERVSQKDHPYPEPEIIYGALIKAIDARSNHFEDAVSNYSLDSPSGAPKLHETFESVSHDMQEVARVFNWAARVDSPRIPFEILRSLSWAANDLLGTKCSAVIYLNPEYDYTIISSRQVFDEMGMAEYWDEARMSSSEDQAGTVLLLGFPSPDAGSTLLHALAAHELGHEVWFKFNDRLGQICERRIMKAKQDFNPELQDYLSHWAYKREVVSKGEAYEAGRINVSVWLEEIAENWLLEVFSDLVAARLVGPAFLAALDRVLVGLGKASFTHPPTSLRRSLVRRYLTNKLPEVLEDPVWDPLLASVNDKDSSDLLWRIGVDICTTSFDELSEMLESITSPLLLVNDLSGVVAKMHEYIDHLAPPSVALRMYNHRACPSHFWLMMYAGWHYRLGPRFKAFAESLGWDHDHIQAEGALGNLVLQGLNSVEIQYRWDTRMDRPGGGTNVSE
jgi:hypothetical protein